MESNAKIYATNGKITCLGYIKEKYVLEGDETAEELTELYNWDKVECVKNKNIIHIFLELSPLDTFARFFRIEFSFMI